MNKEKTISENELSNEIENSTLQIITHQVFMHYFDPKATPNAEDPEWQNQGIFFWNFNEQFEKKSLPELFRSMEERYFIVNGEVHVLQAIAAPWFGQPGGGTKYQFGSRENPTPILELIEKGIISYIKFVRLTKENSHILKERNQYFFLLNYPNPHYDQVTNKFIIEGKSYSLSELYSSGRISIISMLTK